MTLALKVAIKEDESVLSFVSRLAQKNHCAYVHEFTTDVGVRWLDIVANKPDAIRTVSELTEMYQSDLLAHSTQWKTGSLITYLGNQLSRTSMARNELKVCPKCILEDRDCGDGAAYIRTHWLFKYVRICLKHGCPLIKLSSAPAPCHAMDYTNVLTHNCDSIRSASLEITENASEPALAYASYIYQRLMRQTMNIPWLDQLDIDIAARYCEQLGLLLGDVDDYEDNNLTEMEWLELGGKGFSIAAKGAVTINDAYEKFVDLNAPLNTVGYTADFGLLYRWLSRPDEKRALPIQQHLHNFICNNYPVPSGKIIANIKLPNRCLHSWPSAAKQYGISESAAYRLRAEICVDPNHWRCFPVGKYVVEFELLAKGLKRYNAAKYLNTSIETFDQIVAARHIPIRLELMHSGQLFRKCDLDSSLERWRSQGHSRADDDIEQKSISLACKDAKVNVAYALKFIMSGSSKTVRIDPYVDGFETIMISSKELIAAYDAEYGVRENEIRIVDVKSQLSINYPTASFLLKRGYIKSKFVKNPRNGMKRQVTNVEYLELFKDRYITLGEMAKISGKQVRAVYCTLTRLGVRPLHQVNTGSLIYLNSLSIPEQYRRD